MDGVRRQERLTKKRMPRDFPFGILFFNTLSRRIKMKILKRILVIVALVVFALLISYLVYTGGNVNA